jgi:GH18 family chitinase
MSNEERNRFKGLPQQEISTPEIARGPKLEQFLRHMSKQNQPEVRAFFESLTSAKIQDIENFLGRAGGWSWSECFGEVTADKLENLKADLEQFYSEQDPKAKLAKIKSLQQKYNR